MTTQPEREEHDTEESSLRSRFISLGDMDVSLLTLTVAGLASIIVVAALIAAQHLPMPLMAVYNTQERAVEMPVPAFVVTVALLAAAWSYVLAGALHAHVLVRAAGLAGYTLGMWWMGWGSLTSGPFEALFALVLVAVWIIAVLLWLQDRRGRHSAPDRTQRARLHLPTFLITFGCTLALFLVSFAGSGTRLLFTQSFSTQLLAVTFLIGPVLFLTGSDFAEWGQLAADTAVRRLAAANRPRLLPIVLAVASLAILIDVLRQVGWQSLGMLPGSAALAILVVGAILVLRSRPLDHRLPISALVLVTVIDMGLLLVSSGATAARPSQATQTMIVYSQTTSPTFSIQHPVGWGTDARTYSNGTAGVLFNGQDVGTLAQFTVLAQPSESPINPAFELVFWTRLAGEAVSIESYREQGDWVRMDFEVPSPGGGASIIGIGWARWDDQREWLLVGQGPAALAATNNPVFQQMAASWSSHPAAPQSAPATSQASSERLGLIAAGWLPVMALAIAVALATRSGRRRAAAVFVVLAGAVFELANGSVVAQQVVHIPVPSFFQLQRVGLPSIQGSLALCCLALLLAAWRRPQWRSLLLSLAQPLLVLTLALTALNWLSDVFPAAIGASVRSSLVGGVVIVVALFWDVATSGEEVTNVHGVRVPRHARVLIYLGYVMTVACAVLFFTTLKAAPGSPSMEQMFESEQWPWLGILLLGTPLVLTVFALRLAQRRPAVVGYADPGADEDAAAHQDAGADQHSSVGA